jgi:hypothetical protein
VGDAARGSINSLGSRFAWQAATALPIQIEQAFAAVKASTTINHEKSVSHKSK